MTRINLVSVQELVNLHLLAEYRELPRVFAQAAQARDGWRKRQPAQYTMGKGHVLFFYDRLLYLAKRHKQLVKELKRRGYEPKFQNCLIAQWRHKTDAKLWRNYRPTDDALTINRERIHLRLRNQTWWLAELPFFI